MAKALISIDYTEDFVADHGKLTAGAPAQAISEAINRVTRLAFERGDYVFFTIDAHEEKDTFHPESKLFPPHAQHKSQLGGHKGYAHQFR